MSHDMAAISLSVLPSYFMKKKTSKEVKGRDFKNAAVMVCDSDSFVTVAMINAEMRVLTRKYMYVLKEGFIYFRFHMIEEQDNESSQIQFQKQARTKMYPVE